MPTAPAGLFLESFLAAAEAVARTGPEVNIGLSLELVGAAAAMEHDGLLVGSVDEHALAAVASSDRISADIMQLGPPGYGYARGAQTQPRYPVQRRTT